MMSLLPCLTLIVALSDGDQHAPAPAPYELLVRASAVYPRQYGPMQIFGFDDQEPFRVSSNDSVPPPEGLWVEPAPDGVRFLFADRDGLLRVLHSDTGMTGPPIGGERQTQGVRWRNRGIWSPCGDRLALSIHRPTAGGDPSSRALSYVVLVRPDGSDRTDLGPGTPKGFSPAGDYLLVGHGDYNAPSFSVIDVAQGRVLRPHIAGSPSQWCPESSRITVLRGRRFAEPMELWVVDAVADSDTRIATDISGYDYFSRGGNGWLGDDGHTLLYNGDDRILRWSAAVDRIDELIDHDARWIALSPDRRWLVWLRRDSEPDEKGEATGSLRLFDLDTGVDRPLAPADLPGGDPNHLPMPEDRRYRRWGDLGRFLWSPDSRVVLLNFVEESYHGLTSPLIAFDPFGGGVDQVTDGPMYLDVVAWRPRR